MRASEGARPLARACDERGRHTEVGPDLHAGGLCPTRVVRRSRDGFLAPAASIGSPHPLPTPLVTRLAWQRSSPRLGAGRFLPQVSSASSRRTQTRRYEDLPVAAGVRLLLRVPRDAAAASGAPGDELCGRRHPGVQQTKHGALHACSHIDGAGGQLRQSSSDRLCRPGTGSPAAACLTFARGDGQSA